MLSAWFKKNSLYLAWTVSLLAILGSLYFSQILHLPPCALCWYQRIVMYPLIVILTVAIGRNDSKVYTYVLPLAIIGLGISIYHNLLYYYILPESTATCIAGVSCTTRQIEWFGFLTIPLLSFLGFAAIIILMLIQWRNTKNA